MHALCKIAKHLSDPRIVFKIARLFQQGRYFLLTLHHIADLFCAFRGWISIRT